MSSGSMDYASFKMEELGTRCFDDGAYNALRLGNLCNVTIVSNHLFGRHVLHDLGDRSKEFLWNNKKALDI